MQWLLRYATRVAVRRVIIVLVLALLGWAGIGRAEAQECSSSRLVPTDACADLPSAYAAASAAANERRDFRNNDFGDPNAFKVCEIRTSPTVRFGVIRSTSGCAFGWEATYDRSYFVGCPTGTEWNDVLKKCDIPCSQKPPLTSGLGQTSGSKCVGGCQYDGLPSRTFQLDSNAGTITVFDYSGYTATGVHCAVGEDEGPPPNTVGPECVDVAGQSICIRPDGKRCHKVARTQEYKCWSPGETGEKTVGPDLQKTNAGTEAVPPSNMNLPSGDNLVPDGTPVTSTTTVTNTTTGNTTTSTTTTNNYTTNHGTDAGPTPGKGDNPNGTGEGEGEGDGDKGTVSGGEDCAAPPACSGNALACWAIRSNWRQSCEGAASGIEGMAELGDAINRATEADAVEWGALLGNDGEGDLDAAREVRMIDPGELDASGFLGGGSCPNFPMPTVAGQTINIDFTQICGFLSNIGSIVLALSYLLGFRIIVGGGSK